MSQPRRVLHILAHLDHGGAQDNTLATCAGLDRGRWQVLLAAPEGGALAERAEQSCDQVLPLRHLRRDISPLHELAAYRELRRLLRVTRPDVVHTHGSKAGVLGRLAAAAEGVPAVHTLHGMPVTPTTPALLRRGLLAAERLAAARGDEVLCVCPANLEEARELRILGGGRAVVVASGVDESVFAAPMSAAGRMTTRRELGIPEDAPVALWVGRLMEQKAPLDLIAAGRLALSRDPSLHILVAGDGPLREAAYIAAAGIERLHMLGHRDDIATLLGAADVFVQSSLWEGLGRALTEASLAGLPAVATRVNGIPDLVEDGVTGRLVSAGAPHELAEALLDAVSVHTRLRHWGQQAALRTRGRFDVSDMVAGVEAAYQRCLSQLQPVPSLR